MNASAPAQCRKATVIHVLKRDLQRAQRLADSGQIPQAAIAEYAGVWTSMRRLQKAGGPGHKPLDAVADLLTKRYVENWARERLEA